MEQLLILSGKGGTGKTTLAASFVSLSGAKAYADCDVDAPNLHLVTKHLHEPMHSDYFGMPKAVIDPALCIQCGRCLEHCRFDAIYNDGTYRVNNYACEGCGVCFFLCPTKAVSYVPDIAGDLMLYKNGAVFSTAELKMGRGTSGKLVTEVKKQLIKAAHNTEFAVIDGSPGIGCPVIASLSGASLVLIVAEPSVSGISDMERIVETANKFQVRVIVCTNKYDLNLSKTEEIENFCRENHLLFVGRIPYDPVVVRATNLGRSVIDMDCIAGSAIRQIYDNTFALLNGKEQAEIL